MKIIYESGDIVRVEDTIDAGEAVAGCRVRLLEKKGKDTWLCVMISDPTRYTPEGSAHIVKEEYLRA
jgi:hypoxanthine-guanine phosphoribosyltransferase